MNSRQIETSREIRLWITSIITPVIIGAATILASNPELMHQTQTFIKKKIKNYKGGIFNVKM